MSQNTPPPIQRHTAQDINPRAELPVIVRRGLKTEVPTHQFGGSASSSEQPQDSISRRHYGSAFSKVSSSYKDAITTLGDRKARKKNIVIWVLAVMVFVGFEQIVKPLMSGADSPSKTKVVERVSQYARSYKVHSVILEEVSQQYGIVRMRVQGTVLNVTKHPKSGPSLSVKLIVKQDGSTVASSSVDLSHQLMPAGASLRFSTVVQVPAGLELEAVVVPQR